jgi:hypothetical protein
MLKISFGVAVYQHKHFLVLLYIYLENMQEYNKKSATPVGSISAENETPVTELPQKKEIDKQIKAKAKELKTLGKEMKSKGKKRSGVVITEEMTQISDEVVVLNDLPTR